MARLTRSEIVRILKEEFENDKGEVDPHAVIDGARSPSHPFHDRFTWDDMEAARERRLDQARALIGYARMTIVQSQTAIKFKVPSYVKNPDRPSDQVGYISTETLKDRPGAAASAMASALKMAEGHLRRCEAMAYDLGLSSPYERAHNALIELAGQFRLASKDDAA